MSFRQAMFLFVLLHGTMCCEVDWSCVMCVQSGCQFVLTQTGKSACVEDGRFYPGSDYTVKYEMLCGTFETTQIHTEKPSVGSDSSYKYIHSGKDQEPTSTAAKDEQLLLAQNHSTVELTSYYPSSVTLVSTTSQTNISSPSVLPVRQFKKTQIVMPDSTSVYESESSFVMETAGVFTGTTVSPVLKTVLSFPILHPTQPPSLSPIHQPTTLIPSSPASSSPSNFSLFTVSPLPFPISSSNSSPRSSDPGSPPNTFTTPPVFTTTKKAYYVTLPKTNVEHMEPQQRDMPYKVPDHKEIFMTFPYTSDCKKSNENSTLMYNYVSSLCTINELADRIGIDTFDEVIRGWLYLNPGRYYPGTCKSVRYTRKKCRVSGPRKMPSLQPSLRYGPHSSFFSTINSSLTCNIEETKEQAVHRLARMMCYSSSLFFQIQQIIVMNNFDFGFGTSNVAFRYQFKCKALYFRKRNCFNAKKINNRSNDDA